METKRRLLSGRESLFLTAFVIVVLVLLAAEEQIFSPVREKSRHESVVKALPSVGGLSDPGLLSHRLISYDENMGFVTDKMATLARGNTLYFFKAVEDRCDKSTADDFISCANNILGQQFYYKSSSSVADAWANRYSDCDLNSYLLMDVMNRAGFQVRIVYSPGHAFISYTDEYGNIHFQETTGNENTGTDADLNGAFYRKALPGFFYQPQNVAFAEKLYPILTVGKLPEKEGRQLASDMFSAWPENPLVQDIYFHFRQPLLDEDATSLKSLLVTDISSSSKRLMLTRYYTQKGDPDLAGRYIGQIDDDFCNDTCLTFKANQSLKYKIILWFKNNIEPKATISMIQGFLDDVGAVCVFIFACIIVFLSWPGIAGYLTRISVQIPLLSALHLKQYTDPGASKKSGLPSAEQE
ncbi:hypothetical protein M3B74_20240 [Citrobacter freundii]|uniref:hypothetical protein n=1 Tax=Citrobacter TaxID=544 RepID=UPI000F4FD0B1|nr:MULTISPECIES: hypothetical protein [Citrobacter]HED2482354.1 hypothetical protein [Citrobacter youngae]AYY47170.1 hypothetical protein EGX89_00635 [Citrobacter freundii]MBJ9559472.1 hypothetical protein [Citrobacter sp. FDAARGOS_156]MCT1497348.1 hypothetical protein [Citrobacter freundii]MDU7352051.1 hypothetical protein [Citrobacter freundii]